MTMFTLTAARPGARAAYRFCLLCCCMLAVPALAQNTDQSEDRQDQSERSWSLGLALGHGERNNPLVGGESININAVVDFSWYGDRFYFDNGDFGFNLMEQNTWSFGLVSTFNNERSYYNYLTGKSFGLDTILDSRFSLAGNTTVNPDKDKDPVILRPGTDEPAGNSALTGNEDPAWLNQHTELPNRDYALNGGLEFLFISPWGDVQAQALTDISSTHNGQEVWLSWSRPWYTPSSEFTLTLGMEWKSHDLVEYYYGVLPEESFSGRPAYSGAAGTNRFIRFAAKHRLNTHWNLAGMVEREFLSTAISNSPIVNRSSVDTFFAGLFYQF